MTAGAILGTSTVTSYVESASASRRAAYRAQRPGDCCALPGRDVFTPVVEWCPPTRRRRIIAGVYMMVSPDLNPTTGRSSSLHPGIHQMPWPTVFHRNRVRHRLLRPRLERQDGGRELAYGRPGRYLRRQGSPVLISPAFLPPAPISSRSVLGIFVSTLFKPPDWDQCDASRGTLLTTYCEGRGLFCEALYA